jgi:predicted CXXCH cytochrome family protein
MEIDAARVPHRLYRVTRVIGGRTREDFAGVPVASTSGPPLSHDELILPVSFTKWNNEMRVKGHSVMVKERPGLFAGGVWNQTCIMCHNTSPRLLHALGPLNPKPPPYQASNPDALLPPERQWRYHVHDEAALKAALRDEIGALSGVATSAYHDKTLVELLTQAAITTRANLNASKLIDQGIGCESCHGGSAAHVADPTILPSFQPRTHALSYGPSDPSATPTRAEQINRTCAQCHNVLFSRYSYTWEGGLRRNGPGGSSVNSGEARDMLLGSCAEELACTSCHNPHSRDNPDALARMRTVSGNSLCTSCHDHLSAPEALAVHSHHPATSEGSACLACHMPQKNLGLDSKLTTYHRIGSPTDTARVERDRPIECAGCHGEMTPRQAIATFERWWGRRYDAGKLLNLYPEQDKDLLTITLERGKPHEQITAAHWAAAQDRRDLIGLLQALEHHPMPLVGTQAKAALDTLRAAP